jgi:hypothetical protein
MSDVGLIGFHELHPHPVPDWVFVEYRPAYHVLFTTSSDYQSLKGRVQHIKWLSPDTEVIVRVWPDDDLSLMARNSQEWADDFGQYLSD